MSAIELPPNTQVDANGNLVRPFPWLTVIGLGAGAVAVYLVWNHFSSKSKLGEIEREEPVDNRHRLRGFSKALGRLSSGQNCGRSLGRKRFGGSDYEFEPETRLEGHRSRSRSTRRFKGRGRS